MIKPYIVHELQTNDDGEFNILRYIPVAVRNYGSEGCQPLRREDCKLTHEHVSCIGSSGNNICGYYMGHCGYQIVRCALTEKENT